MNSVANKRISRELQLLARGSAAPGIAAWAREQADRLDVLDAEITGADDTPYQHGVFRLEINIPREYPFKPPRVRFVTKIYHPNVDSDGRICLDSLNMPPKGVWKPSLNVATVLTSIQALMSTPNAEDGLMADITHQYRTNPALFRRTAEQWTKQYATPRAASPPPPPLPPPSSSPADEARATPQADRGADAERGADEQPLQPRAKKAKTR